MLAASAPWFCSCFSSSPSSCPTPSLYSLYASFLPLLLLPLLSSSSSLLPLLFFPVSSSPSLLFFVTLLSSVTAQEASGSDSSGDRIGRASLLPMDKEFVTRSVWEEGRNTDGAGTSGFLNGVGIGIIWLSRQENGNTFWGGVGLPSRTVEHNEI